MSVAAGRSKATGHYIRKRLRTAGWARRCAVASGLLLALSILAFRIRGIDFESLKAALVVVFSLAVIAFAVGLAGLLRVWRSGYAGGGPAVGAVFLALLVGAPFALVAYLAAENPPTNTAETDGMLAADLAAGGPVGEISGPNAGADTAASASSPARPPITSRRFEARASQVYAVARTVLAEEGWKLVAVDTDEEEDGKAEEGESGQSGEGRDLGISGTIDIPVPTPRSSVDLAAAQDPFARPDADAYTLEAVATSLILALPSDVTIRISEDGTETFVDMRSTSRLVARDLGQNRRFIDGFLVALDAAMAGVAAVVPPGADG